jgi:hypothetical protein
MRIFMPSVQLAPLFLVCSDLLLDFRSTVRVMHNPMFLQNTFELLLGGFVCAPMRRQSVSGNPIDHGKGGVSLLENV